MNQNIIQEIIDRNAADTIHFPEVVSILKKEKIEGYHVDFLRNENRYYAESGESVVMKADHSGGPIAEHFDVDKFKKVLQTRMENKMSYEEFCHEIKAAGCVYYIAHLKGRKVRYLGRDGEEYIQQFPSIIP